MSDLKPTINQVRSRDLLRPWTKLDPTEIQENYKNQITYEFISIFGFSAFFFDFDLAFDFDLLFFLVPFESGFFGDFDLPLWELILLFSTIFNQKSFSLEIHGFWRESNSLRDEFESEYKRII